LRAFTPICRTCCRRFVPARARSLHRSFTCKDRIDRANLRLFPDSRVRASIRAAEPSHSCRQG
jgi:hypothetical protein